MRIWAKVLASAAIISALSGCGSVRGDDSAAGPPNLTPPALAELIPILEAPDSVSVYMGFTSGLFPEGEVFVPTNRAQAEEIWSTISAIDPAQLAPYSGTSPIMGSAMELGIGQGEEHCRLSVILTEESLFVGTRYPEEIEWTWFQGPAKALSLPSTEFGHVTSEVLSDSTDTEHTGTVLVLDGSVAERTVSKGYSAYVQNILEGTAATAEPLNSQGKYEFDLQFTMGGTIYQIESASGIFSREADGTTSVYQLEPNWLYICLLYLETAE